MSKEKEENAIEKALKFIEKYQNEHDEVISSGGDTQLSSVELTKKFKGIIHFLEKNKINKNYFFDFLIIGMALKKLEDKKFIEGWLAEDSFNKSNRAFTI